MFLHIVKPNKKRRKQLFFSLILDCRPRLDQRIIAAPSIPATNHMNGKLPFSVVETTTLPILSQDKYICQYIE